MLRRAFGAEDDVGTTRLDHRPFLARGRGLARRRSRPQVRRHSRLRLRRPTFQPTGQGQQADPRITNPRVPRFARWMLEPAAAERPENHVRRAAASTVAGRQSARRPDHEVALAIAVHVAGICETDVPALHLLLHRRCGRTADSASARTRLTATGAGWPTLLRRQSRLASAFSLDGDGRRHSRRPRGGGERRAGTDNRRISRSPPASAAIAIHHGCGTQRRASWAVKTSAVGFRSYGAWPKPCS